MRTPWPISTIGATMVTMLSSPIVTHAFGLNAAAADAVSRRVPKATATLKAPVVTRNERRESACVLVSFNMVPSLSTRRSEWRR